MTIRPTRRLLAVVPLLGFGAANAALPSGVSGPWYNPEQSGHGITVEVISPDRALVFWHVYDRAGNPLTLYIEGEIQGRRIEGIAYAPRGMRFGDFDPASLQLPRWGEVDLEFDSCQQATLHWRTDNEDFGNGQLGLSKLADLQQDDCQLPIRNAIPAGLYRGQTSGGHTTSMSAMVDGEGRLWALEDYYVGNYGAPLNPGFSQGRQVFSMPQAVAPGCTSAAAVRGFYSYAASSPRIGRSESSCWTLTEYSASIRFDFPDAEVTFTTAPPTHQQIAPLTIEHLTGSFQVPIRHQFFVTQGELRIEPDGRFCLDLSQGDPQPCDHRGRFSFPDGELGLLDYELDLPGDGGSSFAPERWGRGWLERRSGETRLRLVGPLTLVAE